MVTKTDHDRIIEIHAVLLGTNGSPGLCRQVERNTKAIAKLWIAITALGVSIGGGAYGVITVIRGLVTGS